MIYVTNGVSRSAYVGQCFDRKNMHGVNNIKKNLLEGLKTLNRLRCYYGFIYEVLLICLHKSGFLVE